MKTLFKKILFSCAALFLCAPIFCLEVPPLTGPVVDNARIMGKEKFNALTQYLLDLDKNSDVQIAVLTIKSLKGESLEDYALNVARTWGLGDERSDKGALLLVSYDERKIRIEVGYGAEGDLTDAKCGLIIRNVIAPQFRVGKYSEGIEDGVRAMAASISPQVDFKPDLEDDDDDVMGAGILLLFFAIYFIMFTGLLSTKFRALYWLPWANFFVGRSRRRGFSGSSGFYTGHSAPTFTSHSFSGGGGSFGGGGASGGW